MLAALTAIFACQLLGETLAVVSGLPLPGPVLGMAILFLVLLAKGRVPRDLGRVGDTLLSHLSLLFVPAGAGIMLHAGRLEANALGLGLALLVSTLATIAVTGLAMRVMTSGRDHGAGGAGARGTGEREA